MATKKSATVSKTSPQRRADPNAFEVEQNEDTRSQSLAKLATTSVLSAFTLKSYSSAGDDLEVPDLVVEMRKAGDEAVAGDMGRVERMLTNQLMTLDAIFNNMAQRSHRQDTFKGIEVLMRLALKAQAQARSTAEALAVIKNPMPYIKQANIAHGHQQVNNGTKTDQYAQARTHAGNSETEPNKLLEADHGQRLDIGAQAQAGRGHQALEAVGAFHRAGNA
jgi:hypothetical protein